MLPGLIGALLSAVAYGVATVLQAVATRRVPAEEGFDPRLLVRLAGSLPYLGGLALDAAGFVAAVLALRTLPLFLVQAAIASSVGVTAVVAAIWLQVRLGRREVAALWVLGLGLLLLAASARAEQAAAVPVPGQWAVAAGIVPLVGVIAWAGRWRRDRAGVGLAVGAGLGFGGVGIAARVLVVPTPWWHLSASPVPWALGGYGAVALYCYAAALQRARVTVVAAVTFAVETVVPALIGLWLLGDRARPGYALVAAAGFVLTVAAALALARLADVPDPTATPPSARPEDLAG
jgi:drug/metabolite transporter (DMT)-like permease